MNVQAITIPGKPIAKKRPRFARRGNFVTTYNDQQTEEGKFLLSARSQITEQIPAGVPIYVTMAFYMPIPKSLSKKKRRDLIGAPHTKKPDLDNLQKFAKDCLNGELWHDDSQVFNVWARKIYTENPETYIKVEW